MVAGSWPLMEAVGSHVLCMFCGEEQIFMIPLSLSLSHSLPPTQYSIIFPSQKIRNTWEEDFLRVKRATCSPLLATPPSSQASPQPSTDVGFEFLHPLHVQSGRAGMEVCRLE